MTEINLKINANWFASAQNNWKVDFRLDFWVTCTISGCTGPKFGSSYKRRPSVGYLWPKFVVKSKYTILLRMSIQHYVSYVRAQQWSVSSLAHMLNSVTCTTYVSETLDLVEIPGASPNMINLIPLWMKKTLVTTLASSTWSSYRWWRMDKYMGAVALHGSESSTGGGLPCYIIKESRTKCFSHQRLQV